MNQTMKQRTCLLVCCGLAVLGQTGCDRTEERSIPGTSPIQVTTVTRFVAVPWISTPLQTVRIQVRDNDDLAALIDMRIFGGFQPEMTDEQAIARFGKPALTRTDEFGGTWARYPTPLGYVELGEDRRTSPADDEDSKNAALGRRSLRAYTSRRPSEVFQPPLLSVIQTAEQITPKASREFWIFNQSGQLILDTWLNSGKIESLELFRHVNPTR